MTKQVEVPDGIKRFRPELKLGGGGVGKMGYPHRAVMAESDRGDYIRVEDLPAIYKHFCDRLLSDEVIEIVAKRQCEEAASWGRRMQWADLNSATQRSYLRSVKADLQAALQATSIPQGCNCSYDRLVTQEQASAIRADCPVHGPIPEVDRG
jgi:hypothetical protein